MGRTLSSSLEHVLAQDEPESTGGDDTDSIASWESLTRADAVTDIVDITTDRGARRGRGAPIRRSKKREVARQSHGAPEQATSEVVDSPAGLSEKALASKRLAEAIPLHVDFNRAVLPSVS